MEPAADGKGVLVGGACQAAEIRPVKAGLLLRAAHHPQERPGPLRSIPRLTRCARTCTRPPPAQPAPPVQPEARGSEEAADPPHPARPTQAMKHLPTCLNQ